MLKKVLPIVASLLLISCISSAQIRIHSDNAADIINYRVYFDTHTEIAKDVCFYKSITANKEVKHFIRYRSNSKTLFAGQTLVKIDGTSYQLKKCVNTYTPKIVNQMRMNESFDYAFYEVTDEMVKALQTAQKVSFEVYAIGFEQPNYIDVDDKFVAEIKNILENGQLENYRNDFDSLTANYMTK